MTGHVLPDGYLGLAITYERMLDWRRAVATYREALDAHPQEPRLYKNFCTTLLRVLQAQHAPPSIQPSTTFVIPRSIMSHVTLRNVFCQEGTVQGPEVGNIHVTCNKALSFDPKNPNLLSQLGGTCYLPRISFSFSRIYQF